MTILNTYKKKITLLIFEYWPCLLFLLAIIGFVSKAFYNYPVAIMALLGLYKVIKSPAALSRDKTIRLFGFAFLCLWLPQLISLVDAVNLSHSSQTVFPYIRFLFAGIFIIDEISKDEKRLRFTISSIFFIVLFWCIDALIQFVSGKNLMGYPYHRSFISGMFYPRNTIGHICSILSSIYFLFLYINIKNNKYLMLGLIPLFLIVLLSGSRSSWIMLALSCAGFFIFMYFHAKNKPLVLKVSGILSFIIITTLATTITLHDRTNKRFKTTIGLFTTNYESINKATAERLPIWETSYNIIKTNYINGIGPRGFRHAYKEYSDQDNFWHEWTQTHPHLLLLELFTETGIFGFVGYLILFYLLFLVLRISGGNVFIYPLMISVLVALFPFNTHMAFYGSIWSSMIWLLISLYFCSTKLSINNR